MLFLHSYLELMHTCTKSIYGKFVLKFEILVTKCYSYLGRAANYCRTLDNVRLNLANVRAKVILIGHWSDYKK
jgi:hypothetical protein